ncbi:hypothetical protein [Vulcanisaeta distributa]|uniref:hypothetical protein n=1 Tax=Vulcanisaeta distributa TaxID=164451 RepID=UPI0006D1FE07|nr:hypothetical protein [Vulcanisaeta distributa]
MSSLRSYLIEVAREYERVLNMYRVLMNLGTACDSSEYVGIIETALIESVLAHSRSLIQFFKIVRGRRYKDVVYYLPYLKRGSAREFRRRVRACPGYDDAQRIVRDVNKYVLHLTRDAVEPGDRAAVGRDGVTAVIRLLCCVFSVFVDYVDARVVGGDVVDVLRRLNGDCVKY